MTTARNEISEESETLIRNYSDDELIFRNLYSKCQLLEAEIVEMLRTKQKLIALNEDYENISRRLLKIKSDFEHYKSQLSKTLYNLKVTTDKQKIISKKNLDEFLKKRKEFEEYYKGSPMKHRLDELISGNRKLEKEFEAKSYLLMLTKKQNDEILADLMEGFQKKVCEFSEVALRFKGISS